MEINSDKGGFLPMNMKFSPLLIVPFLAILAGGCASNSSTPSNDMLRPTFPAFSSDSNPDPPNYEWMDDQSFTYNDSDRAATTQQ